jgi:hypothetical protein
MPLAKQNIGRGERIRPDPFARWQGICDQSRSKSGERERSERGCYSGWGFGGLISSSARAFQVFQNTALVKYFKYRTRREKMAVVHDAFEAVVKALASTVEVEQLSGAILLRRFFDPKSEVGIGNCPYKNEVVNVIAASLRGQETGNFQKLLVDSLAYAPTLRHADLQRTNLQNGYLAASAMCVSNICALLLERPN